MKKVLLSCIALLTIFGGGANSVKAEDGTKTPIKLTGATNSPTIEPIAPSTLDDLYAATFTPTADYSNIFKYSPFNVDFSQYDKIVIEFGGENGVQGAWNINLPDGSFPTITAGTKKYEISLAGVTSYADFTIFNWGSERTPITITECYFFKSADPLASFKTALSNLIARAKMYNGVAYTTASFGDLKAEITTAESALAAAASEESLTTATTNLQEKIDALELAEGYENLTKDMMFSWAGWGADAVKGSVYGSCQYILFESTGQPYGDPSVNAWADLSSYEKLIVVATGTPRFLFNRDADNGQWNTDETQSHLIDNTVGDANSWHAQYFSQEENVYTVDLATLTTNKGFAYLNAIKARSNITVSGMYLYRTPDPLQTQKDDLQTAINLGKAQNPFAKTTDSWNALQTAINDATAELANASADAESLTNAKNAINNAIKGFVLLPGYTNLTQDMYQKWDSATVPTTSTDASESCFYNLNASVGQPYGDGNVKWYHYADMSDFTTLTILSPAGTPRIMMNRAYADTGDGGDYVELKNAPAEGKVTVDLTAYDYAHLNAIKEGSWGAKVTVTGMYLYRALSITEAGMATFGSLYKTANLSGATTVYAAKYENGSVKLTAVDSKNVPAGKGVIVEGSGEIVPTFDVEAADIESDLLVSNGTVAGDGSTIYVLANGGSGIGFYLLKDGDKVPAGKAYLNVSVPSGREFIGFAEDVTAIKSIETVKADGAVYNLAGQQVKNAQKGVFIINGKKVIVK